MERYNDYDMWLKEIQNEHLISELEIPSWIWYGVVKMLKNLLSEALAGKQLYLSTLTCLRLALKWCWDEEFDLSIICSRVPYKLNWAKEELYVWRQLNWNLRPYFTSRVELIPPKRDATESFLFCILSPR